MYALDAIPQNGLYEGQVVVIYDPNTSNSALATVLCEKPNTWDKLPVTILGFETDGSVFDDGYIHNLPKHNIVTQEVIYPLSTNELDHLAGIESDCTHNSLEKPGYLNGEVIIEEKGSLYDLYIVLDERSVDGISNSFRCGKIVLNPNCIRLVEEGIGIKTGYLKLAKVSMATLAKMQKDFFGVHNNTFYRKYNGSDVK